MKIPIIWTALGILAVVMGFLLFAYKYLLKGDNWHWTQFRSLETAVSVAVCVGVMLLVVVAVEHWLK